MQKGNENLATKVRNQNRIRTATFIISWALAIVLGFAPHGYAINTDQDNGSSSLFTSYGCGTGGSANLYQTFIPSVHTLKAVDLRLRCGGSFPIGGYDSTIYLRSGTPDGTLLGSATAHVEYGGGLSGQLVRFVFAQPICLIPGQTYVIEWDFEVGDFILTWIGNENFYPNGIAYGCAGMNQMPLVDFCFITYYEVEDEVDTDSDGRVDVCDICPYDPSNDSDGDGICGDVDNCPNAPNPAQENWDLDNLGEGGDGYGDACDPDDDNDGICDGDEDVPGYCSVGPDNCRFNPNADQLDFDQDGVGDACDDDADNDGIPDAADNCVFKPNADQLDFDLDGIGDVCDSCPTVANADDGDSDEDGIGNACDSADLSDPPGTEDSVTYNICVTFDGDFVTCAPGHRNTTITCCNGPCVFDEYSKFTPSNMLKPAIHTDTSAFTIILNPNGTVAAGGDLINVTQNQPICFDVNLLDYYSPDVLSGVTEPLDCFAATSCNNKDPEIVDGQCQAPSPGCVEIKNYTVKTTVPTTSLNLSVDIDIRPLSEKNLINPLWKGLAGVVPVAILSQGEFDARTVVKRNSLRFGVEGKEDSILRIAGIPVCAGFDVDRDKDKDLVCLFRTEKMGDIGPETEKLNMSGGLKGETATGFVAFDAITTDIPRCR